MANSHDDAGARHDRVSPGHTAPRRPVVPGAARGAEPAPKAARTTRTPRAPQPERAPRPERTRKQAGAPKAGPTPGQKGAPRAGRAPRHPRGREEAAAPVAERAPEPWFRSIRVSGFTIVILGLVVLTAVVLAPSLRILIEQRQTIVAMQAALDERQQSVDELERDVARWQDPAYIEAQARERLYYVYPGEYSYLVIDDTGAQSTSTEVPISDEIQTTKVDWVNSLLASVYMAGLTDATPDELTTPELGG